MKTYTISINVPTVEAENEEAAIKDIIDNIDYYIHLTEE
jgi:hypothetical protein